jgi:hypothetical protein
MKTHKLWLKIENLILESEASSSDWVNVISLRRCSYVLTLLMLLLLIDFIFIPFTFLELFQASANATRIHRWSVFFLCASFVIWTITTALFYFREALSKGLSIYLSIVLLFYGFSVSFFGLTYFYLFLLFPNLFIIDGAILVIPPTYGKIPTSKFEFLLFSAFQSVNGSYYSIRVNSAWASLITYIQSVFTIALIALLIASYVNQKTNKKSTST